MFFFTTAEKAALQNKRNRIAGRFTKQRCDKVVRNMQRNLVEKAKFLCFTYLTTFYNYLAALIAAFVPKYTILPD